MVSYGSRCFPVFSRTPPAHSPAEPAGVLTSGILRDQLVISDANKPTGTVEFCIRKEKAEPRKIRRSLFYYPCTAVKSDHVLKFVYDVDLKYRYAQGRVQASFRDRSSS